MMKQLGFNSLAFDSKKKTLKKEVFLAEMDKVVPWIEFAALVAPHYPKAGNGRPPMPLSLMLRLYCCQQWFNLSDPGMEEALYYSLSLQRFCGIELGRDAIPDETTILNFRRLIEKHDLANRFLQSVNHKLEQHGLLLRAGTTVDATLIAAPTSTKNDSGKRDEEMHQTKKGNQWYFGMKMHVGTDSKTGLVHSVVSTAANVHDSQMMDDLLHGEEKVVYGDSAYASAEAKEIYEAQGIQWRVQHKAKSGKPLNKRQQMENRRRSKIRAIGEHAFRVVKHLWQHNKTRYRGLRKNTVQLTSCFALCNLYRMRRQIVEIQKIYEW